MTAARSWTAWSCTVRVVVTDARALDDAAESVRTTMERVEGAASRFRRDSELSVANSRAGRPTPISPLFADLVEVALAAARVTDGAVDPTLGRELAGLGYDRDIEQLRGRDTTGSDPATTRRRRSRWADVRLDRAAGLLTVPRGAALDLGATAKARTADLAANEIGSRLSTGVLVEIGGDLCVAGPKGAPGFAIRVAEAEGGPGEIVTVHRGGVATSTTTLRRWRRDGDDVHHLLDPRTGAPADGPWRTATVAASTCLAANTASTAAIVLGAGAPGWLAQQGFAARLVGRRGDVVTTGVWPGRLAS